MDREKKHRGELYITADDLFEGFIEICWLIHRSIYGDIQKSPTKDFIKKCIAPSLSVDTSQMLDFWIRSGVFFLAKTENQGELILPRHLSFLEYGFAHKISLLWDNPEKRDHLWTKIKTNIKHTSLREPLLLFISMIQAPDSFINRIRNQKDDFFHYNLVFLIHAMSEVNKEYHNTELIEDITHQIVEFWPIRGYFEFKEKIMRYLGSVIGINGLAKLYKIETIELCRMQIVKAIANLKDKAAIPLLKQIFDHEKGIFQYEIAEWLGNLGDNKSAILLLRKINDEDSHISWRCMIAESIAKFGDKEFAISSLKKLFKKEKNRPSKHLIASSIGRSGETQLAISLLEQLFEISPWDCEIAVSIGKFGGKELAISLLQKYFRKHKDKESRIRTVICAGKLGGVSNIPLFKQFYEDETNTMVRMRIAKLIGQLGEKEYAISLLKQLFEQEIEKSNKQLIANSIGELGYKKTAISLLNKIYNEIDCPHQKRRIASLISKFGNTNLAFLLLKQLFEEKTDEVGRQGIAESIGKLGYKKTAISLLRNVYQSQKDEYMRFSIVLSIKKFGENKLALSLFEQLYEETGTSHTKAYIAFHIGKLGNSKVGITLLKKIFESEKRKDFRQSIASMICELADKTTIPLLNQLLKMETDAKIRRYIVLTICELGDKTTIPTIKQFYEKETDSGLITEIVEYIYKITQKESISIYEGKNSQWEIADVPERYAF